jgi:hypothetical protein
MTAKEKPLTVISLTAENFKRLKAVHIEPDADGNLVVISGRNGAGKSSVLDSIWAALAGKAGSKMTPKPIREGESSAHVEVDLGEFTVTRWWYANGKSELAVVAKPGRVIKSPQTFLDERLGALSFDPLAFTRKPQREQLADLLELVDLPFDPLNLATEREMLYGQRTDVGRTLKSLQGQYDGLLVPEDVPDDEVSTVAILEALAKAEAVQRSNAEIRTAKEIAENTMTGALDRVTELKAELAVAEERLGEVMNAYEAMTKAVAVLPDVPDLDTFRYALHDAEALNAGVREKQAKMDLAEHIDAVKAEQASYTKQIDEIDQKKADAVAAAEMPVPGLSFDDEGVMFNGIPFGQCSAAEQLKVSIGMAIAANATIGVLRITDGSLLDKDSMAVLATMCREADMQCWIERVSDEGDVGFIVEDGEVTVARLKAAGDAGAAIQAAEDAEDAEVSS